MYRVKLKKSAKEEYDEIIEFENENKAQKEYWRRMDGNYYYGAFTEVVNGREETVASFCKSEFANA